MLTELDYVGVLTIEWFQDGPRLLANEMAPRVHNSGHWTIEGALTSQFENHVRAVCGLPLGRADAVGFSVMYNFIGSAPPTAAVLANPDAHLHLYGKSARPGRKVGHVTLRRQRDRVAGEAARVGRPVRPPRVSALVFSETARGGNLHTSPHPPRTNSCPARTN